MSTDETGKLTVETSTATSVCRAILPSLIHLCAIELFLPQADVDIVVSLTQPLAQLEPVASFYFRDLPEMCPYG